MIWLRKNGNYIPVGCKANANLVHMDTDELSEETYRAVLVTSEKFNHNLTLQFGLLASDCLDDNDFLKKANQLIIDWKSDLADSINDIFFDTAKLKTWNFENVLLEIQNQIEKVSSTPIENVRLDFKNFYGL